MTGYFDAGPRPLTTGDAEPVRALVLGGLGVTPYVDHVLELLAGAERGDVETHALVIERDGTVAALALFGPVAGAANTWKIDTVLVAPRVDLRETGGAMVHGVLERVRSLGGRLLLAELPEDAVYGRTLSLLRANGFEQEARVADFYRDGVALLFLRRLL